MLSIRDCLDYCDLTEDEVELIAEHESIPETSAAYLACALVQTPEGTSVLARYLDEIATRASERGDSAKVRHTSAVSAKFIADHPLACAEGTHAN